MEKVLKLYTQTSSGTVSPFPSEAAHIWIGDFQYSAKRMGGAPTITATVMYERCLDDEWGGVFADFNGERYYLKQTPTSSKNNEDARYSHEMELVSERVILDNVYFYDVVADGEIVESDKPVSNNSNVVFYGDIHEFVDRLNHSLTYSNLDYHAVVDDGVTSEPQMMSFENEFFSNVLQEIYNTYELPYYFEGKTIHIGYDGGVLDEVFSYDGASGELLSIKRENTNSKIVNRATGVGSQDNIPYYYPNEFVSGTPVYEVENFNLDDVVSFNADNYGDAVGVGAFTFCASNMVDAPDFAQHLSPFDISSADLLVNDPVETAFLQLTESHTARYQDWQPYKEYEIEGIEGMSISMQRYWLGFDATVTESRVGELQILNQINKFVYLIDKEKHPTGSVHIVHSVKVTTSVGTHVTVKSPEILPDGVYEMPYDGSMKFPKSGRFVIRACAVILYKNQQPVTFIQCRFGGDIRYTPYPTDEYNFFHNPNYDKNIPLGFEGVLLHNQENLLPATLRWEFDAENKRWVTNYVGSPTPTTITLTELRKAKTQQTLMPSIYRGTNGKDRFYDAVDDKYTVDGYEVDYDKYDFNNNYFGDNPKEHIAEFNDVKPSIKEAEYNGHRIDMFVDIAYDDDDNNETYEDKDGDSDSVYFTHPLFFVKLPAMGFNLFDHAIEQQPMTIEMTSGHCGACKFTIAVDEDTNKNLVQVDANGDLLRDANGNVLCGSEAVNQLKVQPQPIQQDTTDTEVWIALYKEEETYGEIMPYAPTYDEEDTLVESGHRPAVGDTFVITGINLPIGYILAAEKKLEDKIIQYLKDNNDEKYRFDIAFSRIYFAENPAVLASLNENSRIQVSYNDIMYTLYVTSFTYRITNGETLPQITVELDDKVTVAKNSLQNAVGEVKDEIGHVVEGVEESESAAQRAFVKRDTNDEVFGTIDFKRGIRFGNGGSVEILDDNSAKLSIDYLEVSKKASFTSVEIEQKLHAGGQIIVSPAAMVCGDVEVNDNYYRCYFQTHGEDGAETLNQFAENDLAICQTYNTVTERYYWRKVIAVGEDYIDLSRVDGEYDVISDAPAIGDKIIQFGNTADVTRQNAIVIAAYGEESPHFTQYQGIDTFEVDDSMIVTNLSPYGNKLTGRVQIKSGSTFVNSDGIEVPLNDTVEGYGYLKQAFDNETNIQGGLVQTTTLYLGYRKEDGTYAIMSGMNGTYAEGEDNTDIATWWGGDMVDLADYPQGEAPENAAKGLIRFDGTGYFAGGNLWWDENGLLHADSRSFLVDNEALSGYVSLFSINYAEPEDPLSGIVSATPNVPFTEVAAPVVGSPDFKSGMFDGVGFRAWLLDGISKMEVDVLSVRKRAEFAELDIKRKTYAGGDTIYSPAAGKLTAVVPLYHDKFLMFGSQMLFSSGAFLTTSEGRTGQPFAWKCYLKTEDGEARISNGFRNNDLVICQTFNVLTYVERNVSNRYYWRKCIGVGADYIILSATDCEPNVLHDIPSAGDAVVVLGNSDPDSGRGNAIVMETTGDDAPALKQYNRITDFTLDGKMKVKLSPRENIIIADKMNWQAGGSDPIPVARDLGAWQPDVSYKYYDRVSHNGSLWLCVKQTGVTTEQPSTTSSDWQQQVSKGVTVVSTETRYRIGNSGTQRPSGDFEDWHSTIPQTTASYSYLWTATRTTYSDGSAPITYSVSRNGVDGVGVVSSEVMYSVHEEPIVPETLPEQEWGDTFPDTLPDGWWLYTRTTDFFSDHSTRVGYDVVQIGTGAYYAGVEEWYAVSGSKSAPPEGYPTQGTYSPEQTLDIDTDIWNDEQPEYTVSNVYLWNFSVSSDSRGNRYVTAPICIGNFSKGIASIAESYGVSAYDTAPAGQRYPSDILEWASSHDGAKPTEEKPYQWNRALTTYNDGTTESVYCITAQYVRDGVDGVDGVDGKDAPVFKCSPATFHFETQNNGLVSEDDIADAEAVYPLLYRNGQQVAFTNLTISEAYHCTARRVDNNTAIKITDIETQEVEADDGKTYRVHSVYGYVDVYVMFEGVRYDARIDMNVDVSLLQATFVMTGDRISIKVDNMLDGLAATGIDVEDKKITATSDNFTIQNNSKQVTASVDADGTLTANRFRTVDAEGNTTFEASNGNVFMRGYLNSPFVPHAAQYNASYEVQNPIAIVTNPLNALQINTTNVRGVGQSNNAYVILPTDLAFAGAHFTFLSLDYNCNGVNASTELQRQYARFVIENPIRTDGGAQGRGSIYSSDLTFSSNLVFCGGVIELIAFEEQVIWDEYNPTDTMTVLSYAVVSDSCKALGHYTDVGDYFNPIDIIWDRY